MLPNSQPRPQRSSPAETGKKVKNYIYQYSDLIGRGNFARVYKGLNLNNHQTLAIKLISLDELKCKHLESLVFEEIKILQLMRHPNILKFHEALLSQRNCYIVTQLCGQGSLEDRMRSQQPLTEQQLGDIIVDLYNGLRYLREKGVTHRDVKPANIFIHNGQRKLADFGLAKFYKQRFHDLDIGSPHYMSPEGLILNNYGEKTDLWSLGITIYELIHGVTPFVECRSAQELRVSITRPIPEHKWRGDIHPLLRQMINRLLEVDEMKRLSVYQLENQPYISMVLQRRKQDKLREGISPERIRVCLPGCGGVGWRPASFTTGVSQDAAKVANQQMYSTNSSEKSMHSAKEPLQQSVNHSMRSLSQNLQQNGELQLSFSKMNNTSNQIIGHGPINEISFNLSPLQGRSSDYNSEQIKHSEGRQTYLYRNPSQQIVPLQNQCLFGPLQRQKTASFQTATTDNQKKQYSSALTVRPKHYFC